MVVRISDDFSLPKIAASGQCFRFHEIAEGLFRCMTGANVLYIRETVPHSFEVSCGRKEWNAVWAPYFDLAKSYKAARSAIPEGDAFMRKAAKAGKGLRILRQDPWETLVSFIASQRKSIPAIRGCLEALSDKFGTEKKTTYETLHLFPSPCSLSAASDEELKSCGLGYRVEYVRSAAEAVLSGRLDLEALREADDETLLGELSSVKGVGIKVASCTALFAYGRGGLAPVDVWIQRVIENEYGGTSPFPSYGENAGLFQQYAFYYALQNKTKEKQN